MNCTNFQPMTKQDAYFVGFNHRNDENHPHWAAWAKAMANKDQRLRKQFAWLPWGVLPRGGYNCPHPAFQLRNFRFIVPIKYEIGPCTCKFAFPACF